MQEENNLVFDRHILICVGNGNNLLLEQRFLDELEYVKKNFCGVLLNSIDEIKKRRNLSSNADIYICGDIESSIDRLKNLSTTLGNQIKIVDEISNSFERGKLISDTIQVITLGQVPINIFNVGVYFRNVFDSDLFQAISNEHQFQRLTDSNKPQHAYRTGIYISKVEPLSEDPETLTFHLLRCSSNLSGPTDNIRASDEVVIDKVNALGERFFQSKTQFNHVLAQVYSNTVSFTDEGVAKEKKAKIKAHSDKTKDMPGNALMAFCSFYQNFDGSDFVDLKERQSKRYPSDLFNYTYGNHNETVLTKLRFALKDDVEDRSWVDKFDLVLYPNSVFIMSLKSNRLYTHGIVPSGCPVDKLPTRMGYVIRCSDRKAVFKDQKTWILSHDRKRLEALSMTIPKQIQRLKELYYEENTTSRRISYEHFNFSLNEGDYQRPFV